MDTNTIDLPPGFKLIEDTEQQAPPPGFTVVESVEREKPTGQAGLPPGFKMVEDAEAMPETRQPHGVTRGWEKPSFWERATPVLKRKLEYAKDRAIANLEIPVSLVTGFASLPIAGLAGLGATAGTGSVIKGQKAVDFVSKLLTYRPTTEMGQKDLETITTPFRWINEAGKFYGDIVYNKTNNPDLAATVSSAFEIAAYGVLAKGVKFGKAKLEGRATVGIEEMQEALSKVKGEHAPAAKLASEFIEKQPEPFQPPKPKAEFADIPTRPEYAERYRGHLEQLRQGVQEGEVVKIPMEEGGFYRQSTYPEFMRGKRWSGLEVDKALDKGLQRQYLTPKQNDIFSAALEQAKEIYKHDLHELRALRSAGDIAKDVNVLMGEEGSFSFKKTKLTPEQIAAKERLSQDIDVAKQKAREAGKEFEEYLKDEGLSVNMARAISQFAQEKGVALPERKEELPKYAASINLEKQNIPDSLKRLEETIGEAQPKKVQTWDTTKELAKEIVQDQEKSLEVMKKAKQGEALTAAEITAQRQINVNAINRLKEMAEELPQEKFNQQFSTYVNDIFNATSEASSEIGRALNAHKIEVSINRMAKTFTKLEKGLDKRQLDEFKKLDFEDPEAVKSFVDNLENPKIRDYFYEYWYNSILSGPPTHVVNVVSNTLWSLFQVPHRALSSVIDRAITTLKPGKAREIYLNEVMPMLAGYKTGFVKGAGAAWELARHNKITKFETKWAKEVGHAQGAFSRSPHKALRVIGRIIDPPTRALRIMDVWSNSIAFDGQLRVLARRRSNKLNITDPIKRKMSESFYMDEVRSGKHPEAFKEALEFGKYTTFMDDPGKFSSWILKGREIIPGGRLIIPFVNTIGKLLARGIEMTPGIDLTLAKGKVPAEVIAKQIEGSVLALYVLYKCDKGEITGKWPDSLNERQAWHRQGKKAWSIKYGDTWYQYRRIEPFATPIAITATTYDKLKNAKDDETATDAFMDAAKACWQFVIDSSYLQMVGRIFNKYGEYKGMVQRQVASFTPYSSFWRSINRAYEAATEGKAKLRESEEWLGAFATVIPGLSKEIPARLNVWGEEIEIPGGPFRQWLPYKWSEETTDSVEKELERLDIYPGLPGRHVTIDKKPIELDKDIYRDYCLSFGNEAKTAIEKIIQDKRYKAKTDEVKIKIFNDILNSYRYKELEKAKVLQRKRLKK